MKCIVFTGNHAFGFGNIDLEIIVEFEFFSIEQLSQIVDTAIAKSKWNILCGDFIIDYRYQASSNVKTFLNIFTHSNYQVMVISHQEFLVYGVSKVD